MKMGRVDCYRVEGNRGKIQRRGRRGLQGGVTKLHDREDPMEIGEGVI